MRHWFYTLHQHLLPDVFLLTHLELKCMFKKTKLPQLLKHVRSLSVSAARPAPGAHQRAGGPREPKKKSKAINDSKAWHWCIDSLTPINEGRYSLCFIKVAAFWNIKAVLTASKTLRCVGGATTSYERGKKRVERERSSPCRCEGPQTVCPCVLERIKA